MKRNKVPLGLIINYKYIFFALLFCIQSCNKIVNKNKVKADNISVSDTIMFKKWLKDTLKHLDKKHEDYKVNEDSLSLEVYKKYDTILNLNLSKSKLNNRDIILAYNLIKENKDFELDNINLNLEMIHFYDLSVIKRKYDHDFEMIKFIVKNKEKSYSYKYTKGNLISKTKTNHEH